MDFDPVRGQPTTRTFIGTVRLACERSIHVGFHVAEGTIPRRMGLSFRPSLVVMLLQRRSELALRQY